MTEQPQVTRADMDALRTETQTHYATKADLAQLETRLIKWVVGSALAAGGLAVAVTSVIQRFVGGGS